LARPGNQLNAQLPPQPSAGGKPDLSVMNSEQMLIALAPEYQLSYDAQQEALTGPGFPAGGFSVDTLAAKVEVNLQQRNTDEPGNAKLKWCAGASCRDRQTACSSRRRVPRRE
jgi:hypothetical protein